MLCSLACDLRVTQMVDGSKGIHAMLSKSSAEPQALPGMK
jgi:acetamidase/formamidase